MTAEEVGNLARPYLTLGTDTVWRWQGQGAVWHEARCGTGQVIEWTVWLRDTPLDTLLMPPSPRRVQDTPAERIARLRRSAADALRANRALDAGGYTPNQHSGRPDCNCAACTR